MASDLIARFKMRFDAIRAKHNIPQKNDTMSISKLRELMQKNNINSSGFFKKIMEKAATEPTLEFTED